MDNAPTDVIANDLAIRLFLFGLAAMSFYENLKSEMPRAYTPWAAFVLFVLSGTFLTPIADVWPIGVTKVGEIVIDLVSWFVLLIAFFFLARPYWRRDAVGKEASPPPNKGQEHQLSQVLSRLTTLEGRLAQREDAVTSTSHKDKPLTWLADAERRGSAEHCWR